MIHTQELMAVSPVANLSDEDLGQLVELLGNIDRKKVDALNRYMAYVSERSYRRGFAQSHLIVGHIKSYEHVTDTEVARRMDDYRFQMALSLAPDGWDFIGSGSFSQRFSPEERLWVERCDLNWCEMKWEQDLRKEKEAKE